MTISRIFTPHPRGRPVAVVTPDPTATPLPTPTPAPLRVYVSGEVGRAAVYELPPGSIVAMESPRLRIGGDEPNDFSWTI